MIRTLLRAAALLCALASPALAESQCPQHYLDGRPPMLATPQAGETELCSSAFATLWSPATRDPVYSAEHLTADALVKADKTARLDAFHADPRLPPGVRAELRDYRGQRTYDRGHMAPAHDMPDPAAMRESFGLPNMAPQIKALNRGPWAQIEESARTLVTSVFRGQGWIVTGPAFAAPAKMLKGRVAVPDRIWKAIYVPGDDFGNATVVGAWVVKNAADPQTRFVSLDALMAEVGVDPFPSLSPDLHATVALPDGARKRTGVAVEAVK